MFEIDIKTKLIKIFFKFVSCLKNNLKLSTVNFRWKLLIFCLKDTFESLERFHKISFNFESVSKIPFQKLH